MEIFPNIAWESLLPFIMACIVIEISPGPNMAFLSIVSATKGRKYGFATVLGVTLGLLILGFAAAAGLRSSLSEMPHLFDTLRIAGVAYLLWLAAIEWRHAASNVYETSRSLQGRLSYFRHGLIVNILNPKALVFYVTILPGFIDPKDFVFQQAIILTLISVCIATCAHLLIVSLAAMLTPLLESADHTRLVRRFLSLTLASIAIWIGIQR